MSLKADANYTYFQIWSQAGSKLYKLRASTYTSPTKHMPRKSGKTPYKAATKCKYYSVAQSVSNCTVTVTVKMDEYNY